MVNCTPEQAAIGVMAYSPSYVAYAVSKLSPEDFQDAALGAAFAEMRDVFLAQGRVTEADIVTMRHRDVIASCLNLVPSVSGGQKYIASVHDAATRRKAAILGLEIASEGKDMPALLELSARLSALLTQGEGDDRVQDMATVMSRWLVEQNDPNDHSVKTGLSILDRNLNIRRGNFVVVGGRPSAGKTAFGLQMGLYMAMHGHTVAFFSYETDQQGLADKLMSHYGAIPQDEIVFKRRQPNDAEYTRNANELSRFPLFLINAGGKSVAWCSAVAAARSADVLIFDYMQLIPAKGTSRYEQVTRISMNLHTLAQTSGRLVIALAQIRRNGNTKPSLEDLKESGQIEQDADAVLLLAKGEDDYSFELAKNKRGITGRMPIVFNGTTQTFYEVMDE